MGGVQIEQELDCEHSNVPRWMLEPSTDELLRVVTRQSACGTEACLKHLVVWVPKRALDRRRYFGVPEPCKGVERSGDHDGFLVFK